MKRYSGASLDEIKRAYRALMKKHHPDKGGDVEMAKKIIMAYAILVHEVDEADDT